MLTTRPAPRLDFNDPPQLAGCMALAFQADERSPGWLTAHLPRQDDQLDQYIDRLRFAATELLMRLSRRFPRKRQGTIFLVTNLTHVVQVSCRVPLAARRSSQKPSPQVVSHLLCAALRGCVTLRARAGRRPMRRARPLRRPQRRWAPRALKRCRSLRHGPPDSHSVSPASSSWLASAVGGFATCKYFRCLGCAQDQLIACTGTYVEETLMQHFGALIAFVRAAEATSQGAADGRGEAAGSLAASAAPVLRDFSGRWGGEIEALSKCAPPFPAVHCLARSATAAKLTHSLPAPGKLSKTFAAARAAARCSRRP